MGELFENEEKYIKEEILTETTTTITTMGGPKILRYTKNYE